MNTNIRCYDFKIGTLKITEEGGFVVGVSMLRGGEPRQECGIESEVLIQAARELKEYFDKKRTEFTVPVLPKGTSFQMRVWEELRKIPYGKTMSYGQVAKLVGNEKASRAVGGANNKNPILIIVPCHRVVGANGKLVGFALGEEVKKTLLDLEKN